MNGLDDEAIRRRAYELSLGPDAGTPVENWRRAQRELLAGDAARLAALLDEQRRSLVQHEADVRSGADPDALRRHRVAARRSRAFLRAARAFLEPGWGQSLAEQLRDLGRAGSPVRDLDVLLAYTRSQVAALDDEERHAGELLVGRLDDERRERRAVLLAALDADGYRVLLDELAGPPRFAARNGSVRLDELAARAFRRLVKAVERLGPDPADAELHALRIAVKRARYATELAPGGEAVRDRFLAAARRLQDLLGEHQDAAVAEQRLREAGVVDEATAVAFVAGRLAERQRARRELAARRLPRAWRRLRKRGAALR